MFNFNKNSIERASAMTISNEAHSTKNQKKPELNSEHTNAIVQETAEPIDTEIHNMYLDTEIKKQINENLSPEQEGAQYWEVKAKKLTDDLRIYEEQLHLSDSDFNNTYGELSTYMKERIPFLIEKTRADIRDAERIVKELLEKHTQ